MPETSDNIAVRSTAPSSVAWNKLEIQLLDLRSEQDLNSRGKRNNKTISKQFFQTGICLQPKCVVQHLFSRMQPASQGHACCITSLVEPPVCGEGWKTPSRWIEFRQFQVCFHRKDLFCDLAFSTSQHQLDIAGSFGVLPTPLLCHLRCHVRVSTSKEGLKRRREWNQNLMVLTTFEL